MLDITFSDSTAGTFKHARSLNSNPDGDAKLGDILALSLALDTGDISNLHNNLESRRQVIEFLYGQYGDVHEEMWQSSLKSLDKLTKAISLNEPIRLWFIENSPSELCGMYYICSLAGSHSQISAVKIPPIVENGNEITWYHSSAEVAAEKFSEFAKTESPISTAQCSFYAGQWKELEIENAPLRAIINGKLMSVPEDFYDFALRANIPDGEFECARLLGKTLIAIPGVGDRWLFKRIEKMTEASELIEISPTPDDHPYMALLKRGKNSI